MARQRSPLPAPAIFEYLVAGRPVSAQPQSYNRERKDPKLPRWRVEIKAAIEQAIQENAGSRRHQLHIDPMRIQIVWFTDSPRTLRRRTLTISQSHFWTGYAG